MQGRSEALRPNSIFQDQDLLYRVDQVNKSKVPYKSIFIHLKTIKAINYFIVIFMPGND